MNMDEGESTAPAEPQESRRIQRLRRALTVFIGTGLIVLLAFAVVRSSQPQLSQKQVDDEVARIMASATPPPSTASLVYQAVRPSVVVILRYTPEKGDDTPASEGSGVVVDENGTILTALHVVDDATRIQVIFADGTRSDAKILSRDTANDIAALRPLQLPSVVVPAVMGDPSTLNVGDQAIVIGNPFQLVGSLSSGVISGLNRSFTFTNTNSSRSTLKNLIQFDAAVNPGNSGGPLLNRNGEVMGIVTSLVNPTKDSVFIGIGFAVPIQAASSALGENPY